MSNQKINNSNRKILLFMVFILKSYESALLYNLASKDNDEIVQNIFLECLKKSATKYTCICPIKSKCKTIFMAIFDKQIYATYFNEDRKVISREKIILEENPENISILIYKFDPGFTGDILFCFKDDKVDLQLIEKLKSNYPENFYNCKILRTSDVNFENSSKGTLKIGKCQCLRNAVIKQIIEKEIIDLITDSINCKDNLEGYINNQYKKLGESKTLQSFINFNYKYADTEFHWNLLKNILKNDSFGPYFVFFLDTSQFRNDLTITSSVIEMSNKVKNIEYSKIPINEKNECNRFVMNSLYQLIFEMKRIDKYKILEDIVKNKLENELEHLLNIIKMNISKRFQCHVSMFKMIFSDEPRNSILDKTLLWEVKYDFRGFVMYNNQVRELIKKSKPLQQINNF